MATPNRFLKMVFLNKKTSLAFFSGKRIIAKNVRSTDCLGILARRDQELICKESRVDILIEQYMISTAT